MYEYIVLGLNLVIFSCILCYFFCSVLVSRRSLRITLPACFLSIAAMMAVGGFLMYDNFALKVVVVITAECIMCRALFEGSLKMHLTYVLLSWFGLVIGEVIVVSAVEGLFENPTELKSNLITVLLSAAFTLLINVFLVRTIKMARSQLNIKQLLCFLPFPAAQILMLMLFTMIGVEFGKRLPAHYYLGTIFISAFSIVADIFLVGAMRDIAEKNKLSYQNELLQTQCALQLEHYSAMARQQEQIRAMRHDISNHIQTIGTLIVNGDREQAENYFESLQNEYKSNATTDYCSNKLVDAVLHNKMAFAHTCAIRTSAAIHLPEQCDIDNLDYMCIFSNLLDNAIEACQKLPENGRYLHVSAKEVMGFLTIQVENSSPAVNEKLTTTKEDKSNHGLGLKIVSQVSKKYDGTLSCRSEQGHFYATVVLRLKSNSQE